MSFGPRWISLWRNILKNCFDFFWIFLKFFLKNFSVFWKLFLTWTIIGVACFLHCKWIFVISCIDWTWSRSCSNTTSTWCTAIRPCSPSTENWLIHLMVKCHTLLPTVDMGALLVRIDFQKTQFAITFNRTSSISACSRCLISFQLSVHKSNCITWGYSVTCPQKTFRIAPTVVRFTFVNISACFSITIVTSRTFTSIRTRGIGTYCFVSTFMWTLCHLFDSITSPTNWCGTFVNIIACKFIALIFCKTGSAITCIRSVVVDATGACSITFWNWIFIILTRDFGFKILKNYSRFVPVVHSSMSAHVPSVCNLYPKLQWHM